jgi:hypothetical protein
LNENLESKKELLEYDALTWYSYGEKRIIKIRRGDPG